MLIPPLEEIEHARARAAGRLHRTPVLRSTFLATESGAAWCMLKCESLQKTGSFKVRGAFNAIAQLSADERKKGVITVSAGNHAQAVAWSARELGAPATVVMPAAASRTKAAASRGYGAEVILHGVAAEAFARAEQLAAERGLTFIHPFEDPRVIAGAATCGLEIAEDIPDADVVVVPIGGGGLISGIASALSHLKPHARIVGVEPTGADSMVRSLRAGHAVRMEGPMQTIADGLASPMAGTRAYEIVRQRVESVVLVTDEEISQAMLALLTRTKLLAEPAGAAAAAALLTRRIPGIEGKKVVALVSGGNVDAEKLKAVL